MRRVIFSRTAERRLENLLEYLVENWSDKVKNDFLNKLDQAISIIKVHPESFPASQKEIGLRKCVVTKQTTVYFLFDKKEVKILTLFDSRQDPVKLRNEL